MEPLNLVRFRPPTREGKRLGGGPGLTSLFLSLRRAFFWLVSLLLASLIWFVSVHLSDREDAKLQYGLLIFGAAVSVLLQEVFRFAYFKLLK